MLFLFVSQPVFSQLNLKGTIWDSEEIGQKPSFRVISCDSVLGIIYSGLNFESQPQSVFAYYATPGLLKGDRSIDKNLPAVVLVHGGGGCAFKEWALLWAKRGYAAIAMDLRGNGPDKKHIENGFVEPDNKTPYFEVDRPLRNQWMFQSVANVILAHNLIIQFPEIDKERTAIAGISWGGIITCIVAGLDQRYKAAVSVYGCGFLNESGRMKTELFHLTEENRNKWMNLYEPSGYIKQCKFPVLFVNGTNDVHFYLTSLKKTFNLLEHGELCVKPDLKHSHRWGWGNEEIFGFIDNQLNGTPPLPVIGPAKRDGDVVRAKVKYEVPLKQAFLYYTTDTTSLLESRIWQTQKATVLKNSICSSLPADKATMWFFSVTDQRGLSKSGDINITSK